MSDNKPTNVENNQKTQGASRTHHARKTYQIWTGEYWTFERIVEDLQKLVRSIVAKTTPEECIDDCMQDAWLRLYQRLENNPDALAPKSDSKSPRHTRNYYVNRIVWEAHKDYGFGPWTRTYRKRQIPESVLFGDAIGDHFDADEEGLAGLDEILFADEHHRNWVEESDIMIDLEQAANRYLANIGDEYKPRAAMSILCLLYRDITLAQGAVIAGCCVTSLFNFSQEARLILQLYLDNYNYQSKPQQSFRNGKPAPRFITRRKAI